MTVTNFADAERAAIQAARHGSNSDGPPLPFTKFTDTEWAKIKAACVQRPDTDWEKVRRDLTWAGQLFWDAHGNRLWLEIHDRKLETHLEQIREIKAGISAEYWGSCLGEELAEVEHSLAVVLEVYRYRTSGIKGRSDKNREVLYGRIIGVWVDSVGGSLGGGESGPLVKFMAAVLTPAIGDETPPAATLRTIIRRHKKGRPAEVDPLFDAELDGGADPWR